MKSSTARAAAAPPISEPAPGADNYDVGREIARGGMGSVMEARDHKLGRTVAVKIMLQDADADPVMRLRFLREAAVLAMLDHPNIVPIYDIVWEDGLPLFYSMKLVKGRTLQAILDDLRRADPDTLRDFALGRLLLIFRKICDAMAFTHSNRVLHRDLKPENIMVGEFGEVLVMDWGLAKMMDEASGPDPVLPPATEDPDSFGVTLQGAVVGTPHYMSPEQAMGQTDELDERTDIYALGGILYAILTLRPPVDGSTMEEVLGKVKSSQITVPGQWAKQRPVPDGAASPKPAKAGETPPWTVPAALSAVVMKALHHDPAVRYDQVASFAAEIEAYQNGFATRAQQAGVGKLLQLFILRHKAVAALLALFLLFSVGFVVKLIASERKAVANEQIAIAEQQAARRALAEAEIAVAESGLTISNGVAMQNALNLVPADLRSPLWHYLMRESDSSSALVPAGPGGLTDAVGDPSRAGVFARADRTGQITLFQAGTGQTLFEIKPGFTTPEDPENLSLAFSADGRWLAAARSTGGGMVFHDARTGLLARESTTPPAQHLEFGAENQILLTGGDSLELWDALSGTRLWQCGPPGIRGVLTPDRQQVLTCSDGGQLQLLSARDGSVLSRPGNPKASRNGEMVMHPDGKTAFIGEEKGIVECVDLRDGRKVFEVTTSPRDKRTMLGISPTLGDGECLLITAHRATYDRQIIQLWSAATGKAARPLRGGRGEVEGIRVHPLSSELLIVGPTARVWNLASPPVVARTRSRAASGMAFWGGDDLLFCGSTANNKDDWGLKNIRNQPAAALWSPASPGHHRAGVSADGQVAAVFQPGAGTPILLLRKSSANGPASVECFHRIPPPFDIQRVYLNRTGRFLAASNYPVGLDALPGTRIAVFDTSTGLPLNPPDLTNIVAVRALGWLHGESSLVGLVSTGGPRGLEGSEDTVVRWDAVSGRIVRTATYESPMDILAVAPDGRRFAEAGSTGNEHTLRIRDGETLAVQQEIRIHNGRVTAIAWHPDRPLLATADHQNTIRLWDYGTARMIREWRSFEVPLHLSFSPTGQFLLSENQEAGVGRIWEVEDRGPPAGN